MVDTLQPLNGDVLLPLTAQEMADRQRLDAVLDTNEESMLTYIRALKEYRDRRLYRKDFPSFDEYLAERRKKFTRSRASQLIQYIEVLDVLAEQGVETLPRSERQTRPLNGVADGLEMASAWLAAQAASGLEQPDGVWVKGAVETVQQAKDTDGSVDTGNGEMTGIAAAVIQSVADAKARQRDYILQGKKPSLAILEGIVTWRGENSASNLIALELSNLTDEQFDKLARGQVLRFVIYPASETK